MKNIFFLLNYEKSESLESIFSKMANDIFENLVQKSCKEASRPLSSWIHQIRQGTLPRKQSALKKSEDAKLPSEYFKVSTLFRSEVVSCFFAVKKNYVSNT